MKYDWFGVIYSTNLGLVVEAFSCKLILTLRQFYIMELHQNDIYFVNMEFHFPGCHRQWYLWLSAQQEMECEIEGRLQENITGFALDDTVH